MQVLQLKKTLFFFLVSAHKQNKKLKKIFLYSGCTALASYYLTWCRHFESLRLYVYNFSSDNPRTQRFLDVLWYQQEAIYVCKLLMNLTVLKPHWSILEPRARSSLSTWLRTKTSLNLYAQENVIRVHVHIGPWGGTNLPPFVPCLPGYRPVSMASPF